MDLINLYSKNRDTVNLINQAKEVLALPIKIKSDIILDYKKKVKDIIEKYSHSKK